MDRENSDSRADQNSTCCTFPPPTSNNQTTTSQDGESAIDKTKIMVTGVEKQQRAWLGTAASLSSHEQRRAVPFSFVLFPALALLLYWSHVTSTPYSSFTFDATTPSPLALEAWNESLLKCERLHLLPGPPLDFAKRFQSDRFVAMTPHVLIRNATIWTGNENGREVLFGSDILLEGGLIKQIGINLESGRNATIYEAHGAWMTPGIFDLHSHLTVDAAPSLSGADDTNSVANPILPYLRSLDGMNTHDLALKRSISGGVTTSLILPGSANNIGGQAFVIKLRDTAAGTPESKVLEMPYNIKSGAVEWKRGDPPRWRHMKMACGENIRNVYKQTRLDLSWNFRSSFEKARSNKRAQDRYCERASISRAKGQMLLEEDFPEELQWEALVDVLRGKVSVATHCYEQTDLAAFIRHTNEFEFPLAAFHHAHEAYLVPDLLKSAWKSTPAVAVFATNARYKREAWRGSEYAPSILASNNITVIMKSDHPVLDSRYLLFEAQQAHSYGLPAHLALASITTAPAKTAGLSHRVGSLKLNYDADLVLWDSHPLALGATPLQVYIDGIPQLASPFSAKALSTARSPPPIAPRSKSPLTLRDDDDVLFPAPTNPRLDEVIFTNVKEVLLKKKGGRTLIAEADGSGGQLFDLLIKNGRMEMIDAQSASAATKRINLHGGSLLPPFVAYGSVIGLTEIIAEKSTSDGKVFDPLSATSPFPSTFANLAVDGLEFGGKNVIIARDAGVAKAIAAPMGGGFYRGVSVAFSTSAAHVLESGAIIKRAVALHVSISHSQKASIASQIAQLRRHLLDSLSSSATASPSFSSDKNYFASAALGRLPLVIDVCKADHIATLINLKREIEAAGGSPNMIIAGAQEAHLLAAELAAAQIAVVLSPVRAYPGSFDSRRSSPGPPLVEKSAAVILYSAGVTIGFGSAEEWEPRLLLLEAAWVSKNSNGAIGRREAIEFVSSNLEAMFEIESTSQDIEFVAFAGDPFEFGSRMVAMSSRGQIELME